MGKCLAKPGLRPSTKDFVKVKKANIQEEYLIGEKISETRTYSISKATHKATGKICCVEVKVLQKNSLTDPFREVKILQEMDHPNIVKIIDVFLDNTRVCIVTEFCSGDRLLEGISNRYIELSENTAAGYVKQIASALIYMHGKGVVHRSISGNHVMFESPEPDAQVKIVGFAESRLLENGFGMAKRRAATCFIAPESISGVFTGKSDVWSLGVLLYIMLSGKPPFSRSEGKELITKIQYESLNFDSHAWKKVSAGAIDLITNMLTKPQTSRFSASQVFNDPWVHNFSLPTTEKKPLSHKVLKNLQKNMNSSKFHKVILEFIVSQVLTSHDVQEAMRIFKDLDLDGDGKLDVDEVKRGLSTINLSLPELDMLFAKMDLDKNGAISYSEFLASAIDIDTELTKENLERAFKMFDKDGDKKISLAEISETIGKGPSDQKLFLKCMKEADVDGDGLIDLEEFCNFVLQKKTF